MIYGKGYRYDQNGWACVHIEGGPYERGFQHGYLMAAELQEIMGSLGYLTYWDTGMKWDFFVEAAERMFIPYIDREFLDEIEGVAAGAQAAGVNVSWQEILAWNGRMELLDYWWPNELKKKDAAVDRHAHDHCSAFIATGTAARNGKIVMAHNSWDEYVSAQYFNEIIDIVPTEGQRIFMQTAPGYIDSFSDYFITGAGLIGTETTIGGFKAYDPGEAPEFFRVRKAMQYADSLDRFAEIMKKQNNGGYANSWLLGDVNSGEIMLFELGLQYYNIERKMDGYFTGYNAPLDPRIRNLECSDTSYTDIRTASGARRVRLAQLLDQNYGRIDQVTAKAILADHYDVYLGQVNPCWRTIDSHYELDSQQHRSGRPVPFEPRGTVDGKVTDSALALEMSFWGRWGNSCGRPFNAGQFLAEHPQWNHLSGHLKDRPSQPWTLFQAGFFRPGSPDASPAN